MSYIDKKVIVIAGAGGGFGRLVAWKAAALGAHVVGADVIDSAGMTAMVQATVQQYGRVDVLANNAGILPLAFFADPGQAAQA